MLGSDAKSNGIGPEKLDMDLSAHCCRCVGMDDTEELIVLLCARIGMIMEDASVAALMIGSLPLSRRSDALGALRNSTIAIHRLMEAALAVSVCGRFVPRTAGSGQDPDT